MVTRLRFEMSPGFGSETTASRATSPDQPITYQPAAAIHDGSTEGSDASAIENGPLISSLRASRSTLTVWRF
jgi:hypothetical protein